MKHFAAILAIGLSFSLFAGNGGPTKIVYSLTFESDDPQMAMMIPMVEGSTLTLEEGKKIKKNVMKMGMVQTQTTIIDKKKGDAVILMSGMMGKAAVLLPKDSVGAGMLSLPDEVNVEATEEKLTIAGYECVKKVAKDETGEPLMTMWVAESLKSEDPAHQKWGGVPLKMLLENEQFTMTFLATEVSMDKLKLKDKVEVPEGYKEMTMEEFRNMSMGGGM